MDMNTKTTILLCAAVLGFAAATQAQDKQTLDLLVSKGLITRAEAEGVMKKASAVTPKEKDVKKLKLEGRLQMQYEYLDVNEDGAAHIDPKNTFLMRRIFLGANADLGGGWKAYIVADFANAKGGYLEKAYITKDFDFDFTKGAADFGYRKINFAVEEYTSSSKLLSIERSLATRYFAEGADGRKLGFAGRHTGIFWNGKFDAIDGLKYGLSVTTAYNNSPTGVPDGYTNSLMYAANVAYEKKFDAGKFEVGANFAYTNGMNVGSGSARYKYGDVIGFNPYIKASIKGFDVWGEFLLTSVDNGGKNGENVTPMGANLGAEYKFDIGELGKIAPTVRLSWLDTDGRGVKVSDGVRDSVANTTYNRGESVYVGLNWYIKGNTVKYQLGYEFARLEGGSSTSDYANANAVRSQIQILF